MKLTIIRTTLIAFVLTTAIPAIALSQEPTRSNPPIGGQQPHNQSSQQQQPADQRGTDKSPLIVKIQPTPKTQAEVEQDAKDRADKAANDREIVTFNYWLVVIGALQLVVFVAQLAVFGYQAWKLRQTVKSAADQSVEMRNSVAESRRAATAMEEVATAMATVAASTLQNVEQLRTTVQTNKQIAERQKILGELQLRAYVSVVIGNAVYQDREHNLRFEGRPMLVNNGNTPATKLVHKTRAAILPVPLPVDFVLPEPEGEAGEGMVGPHQNRILSGVVSDFVDDVEIEAIKRGDGKALYVWGSVTYEDAFRESRRTDFCQILTWLGNGQVLGYYVANRNTAT